MRGSKPIARRPRRLKALTLQAEIPAGRAATTNTRQSAFTRVGPGFGLGYVHERPHHNVLAAVRHKTGRHRFERALEEEIEQDSLDEVVEVVPEGNFRRPDLGRDPIEHSAAQTRAERTRRVAIIEQVIHHRADGRVFDAALPTAATPTSKLCVSASLR